MTFANFYAERQSLALYINRNVIRDNILSLTGIPRVTVALQPLDIKVCRGIYLSPRNTDHHFTRQFGHHVVVVAQELNRCWQRFIAIKEMMHLFGDPDQAVDSGDKLEILLQEFSDSSSDVSPQMESELDCFWMALAAICREDRRLEYQGMRAANEISDYQIALELKIPERYVPRLFENRYRRIVDRLIAA